MPHNKVTKLKPFQKLLTIMISGNLVTVQEIDATLGKEIYLYRLSTYIWHIKTVANGIVKVIKDGRKVIGYQLVNVNEIKEYMNRVGINSSGFTPGSVEKKPSIAKLSELKAKPVKKNKEKPAETPAVKPVELVEPVEEEMIIIEVKETNLA